MQILFKAKSLEGEWIEGSHIDLHSKNRAVIVDDSTGVHFTVRAETVGQYIGTEINKIKGFSGDILGEPRVGEEHEKVGVIIYDTDLSAFVVEKENGGFEYLSKHILEYPHHEIIGSIHNK